MAPAFDLAGIPFTYMSTQKIASEADLNSKYDVIIFAPVGRASSTDILDGVPMWTNPMPWQKTDLTPNLGRIDETADTRPGLGYDGLAKLKSFVSKGGLLITCEDTAQFAIDTGLAPGVSISRRQISGRRQCPGQRLRSPRPAPSPMDTAILSRSSALTAWPSILVTPSLEAADAS